jgi:spoIIIJ-associated protein
MAEQRTNIEIIAPSMEEAIENGLTELGLTEDEVDIEILDQGSRGLFGLGSRQARVRLTVKGVATANQDGRTPILPLERDVEPDDMEESVDYLAEPFYTPAEAPLQAGYGDEDQDDVLQVVGVVVRELLAKMKVKAQVTVHYAEPEDERSKALVWVDVRGGDLSILIGPHAETLNALQYIAGLIASKEVGHTVPLVIDVEGFRARRAQQLRQLARRMADQAVKTGRRQVLEPMPASDRRIVHIELRSNPLVTTESIGEEPRRKVTIIPK